MDWLDRYLGERQSNGLMRQLRPAENRGGGRVCVGGREYYDFSSNDYLGLSDHPKLKEASINATQQYGTGSSASRLLSGDIEIFHELEERTAKLKGKERALLFSSGYQANVGVVAAFCGKGDAVFCDRLSHASILDGAAMSGAKLIRFRHNDAEHLEDLLKKRGGDFARRLIVTESIFSMDGDKGAIGEIADVGRRYGCMVMADEAHATGVFGPGGSGVVAEAGASEKVDIVMGTFSKALGSFGGYVAGDSKIIDYLINACRSFIYTTALPGAVAGANIAALKLLDAEPERRKILLGNAEYFRGCLIAKGLEVLGESQIVPVVVGDADRAVRMSERLREDGFWVLPIRPPTVPEGSSRLRFSVTYGHSREVLMALCEKTAEVFDV